ncbi:hypothetical protein MHB63_10560 [Bacillus sp. FSL H8-0547]
MKKLGIGIAAGIILAAAGISLPRSEEELTVMIEDEKVTYTELAEKIEQKEAELIEVKEKSRKEEATFNEEVDSINKELESRKKEHGEVIALIETKSKIEEEIKAANEKLSTIQGQLDQQVKDGQAIIDAKLKESQTELEAAQGKVKTLNNEIESKKKELSAIEGGIKEKKDAPKILPAGFFTVGKDIPEGRYKVVAVGQGSNFVVYDSTGGLIANTIIGNMEGLGVKEYVIGIVEGYMIEANDSFKFIPVE